MHNACKFTDKGYIHITVQDVSREINLPGGYDNSIKLSQVVVAVKDTGRGSESMLRFRANMENASDLAVSADFLDRAILRPFAKADPFMPGAGLGLGLAQRMIEILGGKLAIKSTLNKGTLVHIEIPLHLLNGDNDSDLDDLIKQNEHYSARASSPVRQDGIMLLGFNEGDAGARRVGRVLLRQLKLRFCRVVDQVQFASLIVTPDGAVTDDQLRQLVSKARPNVEVISLVSAKQALTSLHPAAQQSSSGSTLSDGSVAMRDQIRIRYLTRPLFPSLVRRIVRPPKRERPPAETYVSEVVGGDEAREERAGSNWSPEEEDVLPSPASHASFDQVTLSDRWSTASSGDPTAVQPKRRRSKRPNDPPKAAPNAPDNPPPESATIVNNDPAAPTDRPSIETHLSDQTVPEQPVHDAMARLALKTSQSEQTVRTTADVDQPAAMRVLVVEDNAVNRRIVVAMLKRTVSLCEPMRL